MLSVGYRSVVRMHQAGVVDDLNEPDDEYRGQEDGEPHVCDSGLGEDHCLG